MTWWTVARREWTTAFASPLAYVLMALFLLLCGYFFVAVLLAIQSTDMTPFFSNVGVLLVFLAPLLTMRLIAEERKLGSEELILTSPVTPAQWVVGKFVGALLVYTAFLAVTLLYPLTLGRLGALDVPATAGGYLGLWLFGAAVLAMGVFASSLTDNQVVAAMVAFALGLLFYAAGWVSGTLSGPLGSLFQYLSLPDQYQSFAKGVLDTSHVVYFASLIAGFIFLAVRAVDARRWA
jgi:ABC-2 type transport system permease protein